MNPSSSFHEPRTASLGDVFRVALACTCLSLIARRATASITWTGQPRFLMRYLQGRQLRFSCQGISPKQRLAWPQAPPRAFDEETLSSALPTARARIASRPSRTEERQANAGTAISCDSALLESLGINPEVLSRFGGVRCFHRCHQRVEFPSVEGPRRDAAHPFRVEDEG
jgi:hypothetical protein